LSHNTHCSTAVFSYQRTAQETLVGCAGLHNERTEFSYHKNGLANQATRNRQAVKCNWQKRRNHAALSSPFRVGFIMLSHTSVLWACICRGTTRQHCGCLQTAPRFVTI
jgi:hypothetical protein